MRSLPERTNRSSKFALLISSIAVLGASAPAGTAAASTTFTGRNGRMAVVVTNPKDASRPTDVLTMRPDGSHRRLITHTRAGRDAGPTNIAFSPDGRRMVFDRRACRDTCHSNVGVMRSNGSHVRLVTRRRHGFDTNFGFSPDGSRVGFTRDGDVYVAGARRGHAERLTRYGLGAIATDPSFSPDGKSVLFGKFEATYRDGVGTTSETICVVAIAGRAESCLGDGSYPLWAPSGEAILFTDGDGSGISTMRPDGSGRTRLLSGPRMRPLAFAPNGRHFAYLRETATGRRLRTANPDGTRGRTITHDRKDYEDDCDAAFSPDSKDLIYRRGWRKGFYASRIDGAHDRRFKVTPRRVEARGGSLAWARRP